MVTFIILFNLLTINTLSERFFIYISKIWKATFSNTNFTTFIITHVKSKKKYSFPLHVLKILEISTPILQSFHTIYWLTIQIYLTDIFNIYKYIVLIMKYNVNKNITTNSIYFIIDKNSINSIKYLLK